MVSKIKGLKASIEFNISVKADSMELHNIRKEKEESRDNNEKYENIDAGCSFGIHFDADEYDGEVDLKELTDAVSVLVQKSVKEVKTQIKEQEETKPEMEKTTSPADSSEEVYSDSVDGDEIANAMC